MGLISSFIFKTKKNRKSPRKKIFVIGYDCGVADSEVMEIVLAKNFEQAIQYAENEAIRLYEDYELAPTSLEFDGTEREYEAFKDECLFNAIGFWCREFDYKEDQHLISSLGIIELSEI